jgi:hypothetical protein
MRSLVAIVTTLATVVHLTIGCCLHVAHDDGVLSCHEEAHAVCGMGTCDAGHDHPEEPRGEAEVSVPSAADGLAGVRVRTHCCDGCDCVATIQEHSASIWMPMLARPAADPGDDDIASIQARRGACDAAAPPLSALLPPLFERLLV